jgi:hypothetical protein
MSKMELVAVLLRPQTGSCKRFPKNMQKPTMFCERAMDRALVSFVKLALSSTVLAM